MHEKQKEGLVSKSEDSIHLDNILQGGSALYCEDDVDLTMFCITFQ